MIGPVLNPVAYSIAAVLTLLLIVWCIIRRAACWPPARKDNGIRVGQPKVYDNRSLSLMLEQLQDQLHAVRSIDSGAVMGGLGTQQSEHRTSREVAGDLGYGTSPESGKTENKNASEKSDDGNEEKVTEPSTPFKWSERAGDLLTDQVNLSYQIFNLRLLLERAFSDRILDEGNNRIQAVIGFPVSIDPPPFAVGCAGTVEVGLSLEKGPAPTLVALFPQEETHNTLSVNRRRFQISARGGYGGISAAGRGSTNVGHSSLRRQAEVVALERESTALFGEDLREIDRTLILAWQFRPAAGERTVAAGLRQMLAVVSLAKCDESFEPTTLTVRLRSFWQKWHERSGSAANGVGWAALFTRRPTWHVFAKKEANQTVVIRPTKFLEKALEPKIKEITWYRAGANTAVIVVRGRNFFTGTSVTIGDETLVANKGLTIKSEMTLHMEAPLTALLNDAVLHGRYGPSLKMKMDCPMKSKMKIFNASIHSTGGNEAYMVKLEFTTADGTRPDWDVFLKLPEPILAINGRLVRDALLFDRIEEPKDSVKARVLVTSEFIPDSPVLGVRWPFFGDDWVLDYQTSFSGRRSP